MSPQKKSKQLKAEIAGAIQRNRRKLWDWQMEHARTAPPPFYCSVDLRDAGYKIVPVDSNLYPAGFNNICPDDLRAAPAILRSQIAATASRLGRDLPQKILILPESHTSNLYYLENLHYLLMLIREAGFDAEVGWFGPIPEGAPRGSDGAIELQSATQKPIRALPIEIAKDGSLTALNFTPDWVLLNNDFSGGYPRELDRVKPVILPSHALGWHSRKKSSHFIHYNSLAVEFAQILEMDPFIFTIESEEVEPVSFGDGIGIESVAAAVERIIQKTAQAFERLKISQKPFAFIKNNAGTYGIGVMVVRSPSEVLEMNRRTKNKMSVGKNKRLIESVIVQEGIPTATLVQRLAAEPVIYLMGCDLIGGFLRTNTERGTEDNLNSQGMVFKKLCMSDLRRDDFLDEPQTEDALRDDSSHEEPVLELVYGSVARISALATGKELAALRHPG
ncbi:MAG: glutamate--cysteine ligase [Oligoflexia bacterium]